VRTVGLAVALLLLTLSACGGGGIGEEASAELQPQVAAVREAVAVGDRQAAAQGLGLLQTTVLRLNQEGKLEDAAAQRIIDGTKDVADLLLTIPEPEPVQPPLQVPLDQLDGSVQEAPGGAEGGQQGKKGEKGKDGDRGKRGEEDD
jgi:hypothetical protein